MRCRLAVSGALLKLKLRAKEPLINWLSRELGNISRAYVTYAADIQIPME